MDWWEKELSELFDRYMDSDEEVDFSDYIDKHASPEFLAMSAAEHERIEALHARGIWE